MKKIDIITVTYNCQQYIEKFIIDLYKKTDEDFNLFIFDNNSIDGTTELLKLYESKYQNLKVIYSNKNINFGPANNFVIKEMSKSQEILFLNFDIQLSENWLQILLNSIKTNKVDVIGCKLTYPDRSIQHCGIKFDICGMPHHIYRYAPNNLAEVNQRKQLPNVTAACMLMKKRDFIEVNGFDEKYINGYEDNDLCMKLLEQNKKICYEPECELIHFESVSPGISKYNEYSGKMFFEKWHKKTLKFGYKVLENVNGSVSIFGSGSKAEHLIEILKKYSFKIDKIYDRKKSNNIKFGNIYNIDDINKYKPKNLIIASIAQYLIIEDLKKIINYEVNIIPVCLF